jgi:cytoplasmic tRNA 2-thiolation protein 2
MIAKSKGNRIITEGLCIKCKTAKPTVTVKANTFYCQECFLDANIHKFRIQFFKAKIVQEPRVILAISGGQSSRMMLELFADFSKIEPNQPQRASKFPNIYICHVDQSVVLGSKSIGPEIKDLAKSYNFEYYETNLEASFGGSKEKLLLDFNSLTSLSSKEDFLNIYTQKSILETAKKHGCNVIAYGDSASLLAVKIIANTAKGRGISLANDVSFSYLRGDGIQVLKPMREILAKEIGLFNRFKSLESFSNSNLTTGMDKKASIDRITADFLAGLQENLPSTVSTITRTAFKIPSHFDPSCHQTCILCHG